MKQATAFPGQTWSKIKLELSVIEHGPIRELKRRIKIPATGT
jgi:hypothetical protein